MKRVAPSQLGIQESKKMTWPTSEEWNSITRYIGKDILINKNDVQSKGFDKSFSETDIIALAIKHKCPLIIRGSYTGKWYLKGQGRNYSYLENRMKSAPMIPRYERCYALLIKF